MLFTTDQQTLDDLNIFGRHGSQSVYNIFCRTSTRGGAALLEEMFRYPMADHMQINRRSQLFKGLAATEMSFPFAASVFDVIDAYMANTDERTQLEAAQGSLSAKLGRLLARDGDTEIIFRGAQALADLWAQLYRFVKDAGDEVLLSEKAKMPDLLQHAAFAALTAGVRLTDRQVAEYDVLFRFRYRELVLQLLEKVYELDVYLSVAQVAKERGFCFPHALPGATLSISMQGVYHPQLAHAVANDISLGAGSNVLFLTGANMAGKSTFMKSMTIALFLAHMGFPVPAAAMEFTPLEGIFTTINLPDNLGMGASHFYAEMLRVKKMALELATGRRMFILFDELFRGTNVKDAYDATIAITNAFAGRDSCLFVLSTHIVEAGPVLAEKNSNVRFLYLPTHMEGQHPVYTYRLSAGITDDRHGMVIINNEEILEILRDGIYRR